MKESFREQLETYSLAITESLTDTTKEGRAAAESRKQELVTEAAEKNNTTTEAEAEVYRIQKLKIEKLRKFKRWLESTRSRGEGFVHPVGDKKLPLVSALKDGTLMLDGRGVVTMGELIADVEWGRTYRFDESVNIHEIRKWHLAQLKDDLRGKLNAQIIATEVADRAGDAWKQEAYMKMSEREGLMMEKRGIIAEKMVATFLEELAYDCPDADFSVEPADAHADVHEKIDFIIHRKQRSHGARIEEGEESAIRVRDIGVQFTTAAGKVVQKEKQLKNAKRRNGHVDDIVLVTIPMQEATALYKKWDADGRGPGGPMRYWSRDTKAQVFRAVMTHVLTATEIDEFCEKYF